MLTVIKRDGHIEPFSKAKLKRSLSITSDASGQPISERDLIHLVKLVQNIASGREGIGSRELYIIIVGVLYTEGYRDVLEAYTSYVENAWQQKQPSRSAMG